MYHDNYEFIFLDKQIEINEYFKIALSIGEIQKQHFSLAPENLMKTSEIKEIKRSAFRSDNRSLNGERIDHMSIIYTLLSQLMVLHLICLQQVMDWINKSKPKIHQHRSSSLICCLQMLFFLAERKRILQKCFKLV